MWCTGRAGTFSVSDISFCGRTRGGSICCWTTPVGLMMIGGMTGSEFGVTTADFGVAAGAILVLIFNLGIFAGVLHCLLFTPGKLDKRIVVIIGPVFADFGVLATFDVFGVAGRSSLLQTKFGGGVGLNGF